MQITHILNKCRNLLTAVFRPTPDNIEKLTEKPIEPKRKSLVKKASMLSKKSPKKAGNHELIGKNTKSGKIEVEKKVPKALREEVAFHEKIENKILWRKK